MRIALDQLLVTNALEGQQLLQQLVLRSAAMVYEQFQKDVMILILTTEMAALLSVQLR